VLVTGSPEDIELHSGGDPGLRRDDKKKIRFLKLTTLPFGGGRGRKKHLI
jgi:hypothetical protein